MTDRNLRNSGENGRSGRVAVTPLEGPEKLNVLMYEINYQVRRDKAD